MLNTSGFKNKNNIYLVSFNETKGTLLCANIIQDIGGEKN